MIIHNILQRMTKQYFQENEHKCVRVVLNDHTITTGYALAQFHSLLDIVLTQASMSVQVKTYVNEIMERDYLTFMLKLVLSL